MTNDQNNELNMLRALRAFFKKTENAPKVLANVQLKNILDIIDNRIQKLEQEEQAQEADTKGFTKDTKSAKGKMSVTASALGKAASVYFYQLGDSSTGDKLNVPAYKLKKLKGNAAKTACMDIYDILNDNIGVLAPDYVIATEVADLLAKINAFDADADEQSVAKNDPTVSTVHIEELFTEVMEQVHLADNLMGKYILTDEGFLVGYHEARKVLNLGIHHNGVEGTITNENTGTPIQGAQVLDEESGKKVLSNAEGHYDLSGLKVGQHTIKFSCPGFQPQQFTVTIKRGKHVHLDVALKPM